MIINKSLFQKLLFIIPLLLILQLCPETSAFETEINLNTDDRPIMVLKDTTFTDAEIVKIDSLIEQIPQDIRDELVARYTGLMDRIFEEVGYHIGEPEIWKSSEAYKEFMEFLDPLGLGMCPFFLKKLSQNDQYSILFISELIRPEYEYVYNDIKSYMHFTEDGTSITHYPVFLWTMVGRKLLEMPDDIWVINTNVDVENSQNLPEDFKLEQNHPNPFNASTAIEFYLPAPDFISLDIYSVTGQKVRELANGRMHAGNHIFLWDCCGEDGSPVSSGIYFYRIVSGAFASTGKMTLMK